MIKIFGFIPCKTEWSRADWRAHYAECHGPMVASLPSFRAHFSRYVQNEVIEDSNADAFVGVSELWADSPAVLGKAFADLDYLSQVRPDEDYFTDRERVRGGIGREIVIAAGKATGLPPFKVFMIRRNMVVRGRGTLAALWPDRAVQLFQEEKIGSRPTRYVQIYPEGQDWNGFDLIDEFGFDDPNAARVFCEDWHRDPAVARAEDGLFARSQTRTVIARTRLVFDDDKAAGSTELSLC
ncbi:EthD domain-containing protein [Sphingobium faniae]|nr:EthD domain-containing protein [Sphingobium faniae]